MCIPTCLHSSDPSIKPKPTAEVDPTVFEKRFLKKVRALGEVRSSATHAFYFLLCTSDLVDVKIELHAFEIFLNLLW